MSTTLYSRVALGDMEACTWHDEETGATGLTLVPAGMPILPWTAKRQNVDSMVQLKLAGDIYPGAFSNGVTLRNSESVQRLRLSEQRVEKLADGAALRTTLRDDRGCETVHHLEWHGGETLLSFTEFFNRGEKPVSLEMLSSFSLCGLTPFTPGDAAGTLRVHRLRSGWSAEGRLDSARAEELELEPSWAFHGVRCERFGEVGSLPVSRWFPWLIVEDEANHVFWGAQIAHNASWQMELYRKDEGLAVSGGLADRQFGHWQKDVAPGESFVTPQAILTVCRAASLDDAACRLVSAQRPAADAGPESEQSLPVMFNEYCTTWGNPSEERIASILSAVKGRGFAYFVIDSGWYKEEGRNWEQGMGDYVPSAQLFPSGLAATARAIREAGMVPGLWFEAENVGMDSRAWQDMAHLLQRDGVPLQTQGRRFRAMADPAVRRQLHGIITELLRQNGFGYIKVDYNDSIGPGCDGYESAGEGLRQTAAGTVTFFEEMKAAIPGLIIENCASGGHRLEPEMLGLTALSSFSDAHECVEIPIIAANLHRAMLPRQCQIWAVLRKTDSARRLVWSIASTFLGRMCVSGDVEELSEEQWALVEEGIDFYKEVAPLIRDGLSRRFGPTIVSYRHPAGWQAMLRYRPGEDAFLLVHQFEGELAPIHIELPAPWHMTRLYKAPEEAAPTVRDGIFTWQPAHTETCLAVRLERSASQQP